MTKTRSFESSLQETLSLMIETGYKLVRENSRLELLFFSFLFASVQKLLPPLLVVVIVVVLLQSNYCAIIFATNNLSMIVNGT